MNIYFLFCLFVFSHTFVTQTSQEETIQKRQGWFNGEEYCTKKQTVSYANAGKAAHALVKEARKKMRRKEHDEKNSNRTFDADHY